MENKLHVPNHQPEATVHLATEVPPLGIKIPMESLPEIPWLPHFLRVKPHEIPT